MKNLTKIHTKFDAMNSVVAGHTFKEYFEKAGVNEIPLSQPSYEALVVPTKRKFIKVINKLAVQVKASQLYA